MLKSYLFFVQCLCHFHCLAGGHCEVDVVNDLGVVDEDVSDIALLPQEAVALPRHDDGPDDQAQADDAQERHDDVLPGHAAGAPRVPEIVVGVTSHSAFVGRGLPTCLLF